MKDLHIIIEACKSLAAGQAPVALATVTNVSGSAYRWPGARMFVYPDGTRGGMISGGCLEADVVQHALEAAERGKPEYLRYDMRGSNGDVLAELGCGGAVGILVEPLASRPAQSLLSFLEAVGSTREAGAVAMVFRVEGECPVVPGTRLILREGLVSHDSIGAHNLSERLRGDLAEAARAGKTLSQSYAVGNGVVEALLEPIQPPVNLLICGAGQDAIPLAQMARFLGWQCTVVDTRPSRIDSWSFPDVPAVLFPSPGPPPTPTTSHQPPALSPAPPFPLDARTAAVVMTHSYAEDLAWLKRLMPSQVGYVGLLGPRGRGMRLKAELAMESTDLPPARLARLHSPVGLDIGSETPEEIAMAISAEIQAIMQDRAGGFLQNRSAPMHLRTDMELVDASTAPGLERCPVLVS